MGSISRDDFSMAVKELLGKRVGYRCSNPSCRQPTSGPQANPAGTVNVGVAAHITAAAPGGARYDDTLTPEQRKDASNGIWLCQNCAKLVDNDAIRYTVGVLRQWKQQAEDTAIAEIEGRLSVVESGRVPYQSRIQDATSRFEAELVARNFSDTRSQSFGRSKYGTRLGWVNGDRVLARLPVLGSFFAKLPTEIVSNEADNGLLRWIDCNKLRYEPCPGMSFIPSPSHSLASKGYVWDNAWELRTSPEETYCTRYLAIEAGGWLEYGFYPAAPWEDAEDRVYYAKLIASFVAFLSFLRDAATQFQQSPSEIGLGLALVGTSGKRLLCIREEGFRLGYQTQLPTEDTFRYLKLPDIADWSVNSVAQEAAVEILDHWSFLGESWVGRPEFRNGVYTGELFKARFQGFI